MMLIYTIHQVGSRYKQLASSIIIKLLEQEDDRLFDQ